jgi:microsomal dipeptidase-like Zn-dependent dipeptidase
MQHIMYVYARFRLGIIALGTGYFGLIDHGSLTKLGDIARITNLYDVLTSRGMNEDSLRKLSHANALSGIRENASLRL